MDALPSRGLLLRRFGDGVSEGLLGSEGAHTICSGVMESPLTDKFSLLSIKLLNSALSCSCEIPEARERDRSLNGDSRRTDRSRGVVGSFPPSFLLFVSFKTSPDLLFTDSGRS